MKFIRTQDNIYQVYKETDTWYYVDRELTVIIYKDEVIREGNSIEELCDEFVFEVSNDVHFIILKENYIEEIADMKNYPCNEIYGAIWTLWGLKYAAIYKNNKFYLYKRRDDTE